MFFRTFSANGFVGVAIPAVRQNEGKKFRAETEEVEFFDWYVF